MSTDIRLKNNNMKFKNSDMRCAKCGAELTLLKT